MAENRKDNKHHTDSTMTGPPLRQPVASHLPQSTAFSETGKLPGYFAWVQLQYQHQLETAIANMSGGGMSRCLAYPQADTQHSPQFLSSTAAPTGLETAYLQANLYSPYANQQQLDSTACQVVPPTSPEINSGQNMHYSTELPAMAAYDTSSPNMDYLMLTAQQSMVYAARSGQDRQTLVDHAVGPPHFGGGEQQLQHPPCQYASVLCLAWSCPSRQVCSHCCITVTVVHCHCVAVQQTSTDKQQQTVMQQQMGVDFLLDSSGYFIHCMVGQQTQAEMHSPDQALLINTWAVSCPLLLWIAGPCCRAVLALL